MLSIAFSVLALAALSSAAPAAATTTTSAGAACPTTSNSSGGCSISDNDIDVPSGQTNVTVPAGEKLSYITFAIGTQNYTCATSDATTSPVLFGAQAALYDASCLDPSKYQNDAQAGQIACSTYGIEIAQKGTGLYYLGAHYFAPISGGSPEPTFDFRGGALHGQANGFVIGTKNSSLASPQDPAVDVPWLVVQKDGSIQDNGDLATTVLRINTAGGQPPSTTCEGLPASFDVCYSAIYAFLS